jgi:hypothetical protein
MIVPKAAFANRRDVLGADIPSMGTMTARAAATVYAALLGHIDAVHLVSAERLAAMAAIVEGEAMRDPDGTETERVETRSVGAPSMDGTGRG